LSRFRTDWPPRALAGDAASLRLGIVAFAETLRCRARD